MASFKGQRALVPQIMRVDGSAAFINDKAVLAANPAATDTIDFLIPAGFELSTLRSVNDDMDTGAALLYSVGYRPVNPALGPAAVTNYFAAAGQTAFRAPGLVDYVFKPIKFETDVYVAVLIGTAATSLSGTPELHFIAGGNMVGPK